MKIEALRSRILNRFAQRYNCVDFTEFEKRYSSSFIFGVSDIVMLSDFYIQEILDNLDEIYLNNL